MTTLIFGRLIGFTEWPLYGKINRFMMETALSCLRFIDYGMLETK